jgi:hypothetical protein
LVKENIEKNKLYQKYLETTDYIDLDKIGKVQPFSERELEKIKNITPNIINLEVNYLYSKIKSIRLSLYSKDTIYSDNNIVLNKHKYKSNEYILYLYIKIYKFTDDYYYLGIGSLGRYYDKDYIDDIDDERYIIFEDVFDQFTSIINYLKYIFS